MLGPKLEFFSEARIAFMRELEKHAAIATAVVTSCDREPDGSFDEGQVIGTVAAHFNIVMDGMYSREDLDHLYELLFHKMRDHRKEVILPPDQTH